MLQYRQWLTKALNKELDFDTDSLKWTLHTSTYTPNYDTHAYVSDLTNELSTAGGYTSGGVTATSASFTYTAANSWGVSRANSTAYNVGDVIRPATGNGFLYRCVTAGTSAGTTTTLGTTLGASTTDGTAVFEMVGAGIIVVKTASPSWTTFTAGPFRYAILSDRTPGTAATQPLIGVVDFGSNQTGGGGTFQINVNSTLGLFHYFIAP
jgi:hypothetical protein